MSLPARTGWHWLKAGFGLLRTQPGILMMFLFTNVMGFMLISTLPFIGPLIAVLLIPALSLAIWEACRQIDHGKRVNFDVLLTGFRGTRLKPLCQAGAAYLALFVVLTILMRLLIDQSALENVARAAPGTELTLAGSVVMPIMVIGVLQGLGMLLLSFAAPLIQWQGMQPGKAIFYSTFGVLGAKRAFLTLMLSWSAIFLVAGTILSALLGNGSMGRVVFVWVILLFLLVAQCAVYAAYRQIFGVPDDLAKPDLTKR